MNARSALWTVAGLLTIGLALAPTIALPSNAVAQVEDVQRVFVEQLDSSGVPGGAFAVVTSEGIDSAGVGTAGDVDATATTPFVIGSTTKSITALAAMQLVESDKIDLNASVRDYVPEFNLGAGEAADAITVRHVLQQTSGLDDLAGGPLLASATDGTPLEAIAELEDAKLASSPGDVWRYANVNYVLAGLVVERASRMKYADYVERYIFDPLGMNDSTASEDPAQVSPGHQFWFGALVESEPTVRKAVMAAGYVVSTADDLGRYLAMYLAEGLSEDGTRVLSAAGLRTLLAPGPTAKLGPWADAMSSRYAMGWFVGGPWATEAIFHPGNSPDSSAMLALFPGQHAGVATLANAGHELPAPGNPALTDRMARNVVHAALGESTAEAPSLRTLYVVFDVVSLLLLLLAFWGVARAVSALRNGQRPPHAKRATVGIVVRLVGIFVLVMTPVLLSGWTAAWTWAPDLALVLGCLAVLLAVTAVLRFIQLEGRRAEQPEPSAPAH